MGINLKDYMDNPENYLTEEEVIQMFNYLNQFENTKQNDQCEGVIK